MQHHRDPADILENPGIQRETQWKHYIILAIFKMKVLVLETSEELFGVWSKRRRITESSDVK